MTPRYAGWMALLAQRDAALLGFFFIASILALTFLVLVEWKPPAWLADWKAWRYGVRIYSGLVVVAFYGLLFAIIFSGGGS